MSEGPSPSKRTTGARLRGWLVGPAVFVLLLVPVVAVGALLANRPVAPTQECGVAALHYKMAGVKVVAVYHSNVAGVRRLQTDPSRPIPFAGLSPDAAATVCYVDGLVASAPPAGPGKGPPPPFDRAIVAIAGSEAEVVVTAYQSQLPTNAP